MNERASVVELRKVSKEFGQGHVRALEEIDLDIRPGEFISLIGPSGCGKSTLLRIIAGLEYVTEGTIAIDGRDVTDLPSKERDIAMVFQSYALYPHMTVAENVAYPLKLRRLPRGEVRERVRQVLELVGLAGLEARPAPLLSGGQQQRVALARALVRTPRLLLCDEPTGNLDRRSAESVASLLLELQREQNAILLVVTLFAGFVLWFWRGMMPPPQPSPDTGSRTPLAMLEALVPCIAPGRCPIRDSCR